MKREAGYSGCTKLMDDLSRLAGRAGERRDSGIVTRSEIIRLSRRGRLSACLALLVKKEFEDCLPSLSANGASGLVTERVVERFKTGFNPDVDELFTVLTREGDPEWLVGRSRRSFDELVEQLIQANLFLFRPDGPEVELFERQLACESRILGHASARQIEEHWVEKSTWLERHRALTEVESLVEDGRLRQAQTRREFLKIHGPAYLQLQEQFCRYELAKTRLELKRSHPRWTRRQVETQSAALIETRTRKQQLERLRTESFVSRTVCAPERHQSGGTIDQAELQAYRAKCKQEAHALAWLIHDDRLGSTPEFQKLTPRQQELLRLQLREALEVHPHELEFARGTVGGEHRTLDALTRARSLAETVLGSAGIEIEPHHVIRGETLEEQVSWLRGEVSALDADVEAAQATLREMSEDKEVQKMQEALNVPAQKEQQAINLLSQADAFKEKADEIERELDRLFTSKRRSK